MFALSVLLFAFFAMNPPGVVIDYEPAQTGRYIGSPSITILPDGSYVASHDFFGPKSGQSTSATTRVFKSSDRGQSWHRVAEFQDQFWSNLFVHDGAVYLLGTTYEYGRIVIRRSINGKSWSDPSYLTSDPGFHTAPVPIVEKDGRLWRAVEFHPQGKWGSFQAFLFSANAHTDLLNPKSWTATERLSYPADAKEGKTWLEGNAVIDRRGQILDILRVDNIEKAAIVARDGSQLKFDRLVVFPGGAKKFVIRYDPKSHKYWALSNPALKKYPQSEKSPASVRNTLVLMSSKDLQHWKVKRTILEHPDPVKHAFQYPDWQFDGNDIIAVSRTAFDDDSGGAHTFHDANFMTFHRISGFRK